MKNITIILIIIVIFIFYFLFTENFEDKKYIEFSKEKEYIYSIHDTKNNVYYDLITLTQLDNEKQKKAFDYVKNSNVKNTFSSEYVSYQIENKEKFSIPNNLLFAYPRTDGIPKITTNDKNEIKFVIDHAKLLDEKTEFKFGVYNNYLLLFKPNNSFNKKNNITITENNSVKNVALEKIDGLDLYQIKLADTSDLILIRQ